MIDNFVIARPARLLGQHARVLLVLVALAGVLAGCQSGDSPPAASAAGSPSTGGASTGAAASSGSSAVGSPRDTSTGAATGSASGCPEPLASNTYVRATSAHAEGNAVVVTVNPARRICGGPNNGHYEIEAGTEQLTLPASATVVLLTTMPSGLGHQPVAPSDLPQRLVHDRFGRIFLVRGPVSAVTSLEEQYHP